MYKTLLVAIDGSKLSDKAVTHAIGIAQTLGAEITMFYAAPPFPMPAYTDEVVYTPISRKEYAKLVAEDTEKILDKAKAKGLAAGVETKTGSAVAAAPWSAILAAAKKYKSDAIVMASHGRRGVAALVLGSETQKVLTHSKVPVLVIR